MRHFVPLLCSALLSCGSSTAPRGADPDQPSPPTPLPPGAPADTAALHAIDAGGRDGAPSTYRGLPLALVQRPTPPITAVDGVIGVVCVGMSNAAQECTRLIAATAVGGPWHSEVAPNVRIVNCAVGGHALERWNDPAYDAPLWRDCIDRKLGARGVRLDQVRVILHKAAHQFGVGPGGAPLPLLPEATSNYARFQSSLSSFALRVPEWFPAVQAVYTSSRSFGGFTTRWERGDPQAYDEGHALNTWLAQHTGVDGIWYGWWGYLWAPACTSGRRNGSGICYDRSDYQADAVHPTAAGEIKIARLQHDRLRQEAWYAR
jgi:hypothetical protein